jgi:hypothetical protein
MVMKAKRLFSERYKLSIARLVTGGRERNANSAQDTPGHGRIVTGA